MDLIQKSIKIIISEDNIRNLKNHYIFINKITFSLFFYYKIFVITFKDFQFIFKL